MKKNKKQRDIGQVSGDSNIKPPINTPFKLFYGARLQWAQDMRMKLNWISNIDDRNRHIFDVDSLIELLDQYNNRLKMFMKKYKDRSIISDIPRISIFSIDPPFISKSLESFSEHKLNMEKSEEGSKKHSDSLKYMETLAQSLRGIRRAVEISISQEQGILKGLVIQYDPMVVRESKQSIYEMEGDTDGVSDDEDNISTHTEAQSEIYFDEISLGSVSVLSDKVDSVSVLSDNDQRVEQLETESVSSQRRRKRDIFLSCCFFCLPLFRRSRSNEEIRPEFVHSDPEEIYQEIELQSIHSNADQPPSTSSTSNPSDAPLRPLPPVPSDTASSQLPICPDNYDIFPFLDFYNWKKFFILDFVEKAKYIVLNGENFLDVEDIKMILRGADEYMQKLEELNNMHRNNYMKDDFWRNSNIQIDLESFKIEVGRFRKISESASNFKSASNGIDHPGYIKIMEDIKSYLSRYLSREAYNMNRVIQQEMNVLNNVTFDERRNSQPRVSSLRANETRL